MPSTQQQLPIQDVHDNLIFLKNGSVTAVIETSAVNFGLLFETEQVSIIESFAGLLNSLSFPIQIIIRSQRLDVSSYLNVLDQVILKQSNPLLKNMTQQYRSFVDSLIKDNQVLDKRFYISVTAASFELGVLPSNAADKTKKAMTVLNPRINHLTRQLTRLGLKAKSLDSTELIKLFYGIYNFSNFAKSDAPSQKSLTPSLSSPPRAPQRILYPTTPQPPPMPHNSQYNVLRPIPSNITTHKPAVTDTPTNSGAPFVVEEVKDDLAD